MLLCSPFKAISRRYLLGHTTASWLWRKSLLCAALAGILWGGTSFSAPKPAQAAQAEETADEDDWGNDEDWDDVEESEEVEIRAVDSTPKYYGDEYPVFDRTLNLLTGRTINAGKFLFLVSHRTSQAFTTRFIQDLGGFDAGGLKIGLGLRYGILDDLDAGFFRLNGTVENFDVYEFDLRYAILSQQRFGIDLAIRGGLTLFAQPDQEDALGGFAQLLSSRVWQDRWLTGLSLLFHSEASNQTKSAADTAYALAVGGLFEARILDWLAWNIEAAYSLAGYKEQFPTFSSSVRFITHRHTFALVLSNSQYMTADGVVANTHRNYDDLVIGFNITREL